MVGSDEFPFGAGLSFKGELLGVVPLWSLHTWHIAMIHIYSHPCASFHHDLNPIGFRDSTPNMSLRIQVCPGKGIAPIESYSDGIWSPKIPIPSGGVWISERLWSKNLVREFSPNLAWKNSGSGVTVICLLGGSPHLSPT